MNYELRHLLDRSLCEMDHTLDGIVRWMIKKPGDVLPDQTPHDVRLVKTKLLSEVEMLERLVNSGKAILDIAQFLLVEAQKDEAELKAVQRAAEQWVAEAPLPGGEQ